MQAAWAWWWAGLIAYIPANLYPMLVTTELGTVYSSTIVGGVLELAAMGEWFVAGVIFFASVIIPVAKFIVIALVALRIGRLSPRDREVADELLGLVELIGRWSMVDVFVVAILSALVQLGAAATIEPGFAAICFALAVVFTMLSAQAIDPRLIFRDREAKGDGP